MALTERGRFVTGKITEQGRMVFNSITEQGHIVLGNTIVVLPPNVSIVSISRSKLSDEVGMSQAVITIRFDKPVLQYVAMLNGVDHTTGINVHTGGATSANTDAQVIVDWNESLSEGENRINIYAQGEDGIWTSYV